MKEERRARFMQAQERISGERLKRHVGKTLEVLVDESGGRESIARSSADAPEIDGVVRVAAALDPGQFARVRIVRAAEHDLWAVPV